MTHSQGNTTEKESIGYLVHEHLPHLYGILLIELIITERASILNQTKKKLLFMFIFGGKPSQNKIY